MRLIDDVEIKIDIWDLFNSVYNDASKFTEEETKFAKRILSEVQEKIDSQPTAYDVDKVVEQIESIMDDESIRFCDQAVQKSINIVKAGGVNE